jgi:type IV pilus assembly protein PilY1
MSCSTGLEGRGNAMSKGSKQMNPNLGKKLIAVLFAACIFAAPWSEPSHAENTDLAKAPLAQAPSVSVLPNLMYILDDSGSMMWDYMPDNVHNLTTGQQMLNCKSSDGMSAFIASAQCPGEPPYYSTTFNQIYYNPDITYNPGVDYLGVSLGNQAATGAKNDAYLDATLTNLTTAYPEVYYCNASYTASPTDLTNTAICRRNGINNVQAAPNDYFLYWSNATTGAPLGAYPTTDFFTQVVDVGHPYYYTITPDEYCLDTNLVQCTASATPTGPFIYPAPVRYCATTATASAPSPVSDPAAAANPQCRKKFNVTSYPYPRYGRFRRVDIVSSTATYAKSPTSTRTDCAGASSCTYAEEAQNFANWYSYYRIRMAMMKTATGRSFLSLDDRYRVGFITINPGNPVASGTYLPIAPFNATQKSNWYNILYSQVNHGGTPLRQALARVGRHYAGVTTGINNGMSQDPVQYSCQQNFALLTTDGYYNDNASVAIDINNAQVGNTDNAPSTTPPIFVDRGTTGTLDASGTVVQTSTPSDFVAQVICTGNASTNFADGLQTTCGCTGTQQRVIQRTESGSQVTTTQDGVQTGGATKSVTSTTFTNITACSASGTVKITLSPNPKITATGAATSTTTNGGTANTLADVAMYYYKNDLRPSLNPKNVPTTSKDVAPFQHMTTFTLGLGLNGLMDYRLDYETSASGDFANIKGGNPGGCAWTAQGAQCNWPVPVAATPTALDDLWHAAVNGRGVYYSASDPNSLANGLSGALAALKVTTGAAAASATSSPNITQTDNFIFSSTFRTAKWDGEIVAQRIDSATGAVLPAIEWSAQAKLDAATAASTDSRTIYGFSASGTNKLKAFTFANLTSAASGGINAEQPYFANKGSGLSQYSGLTATQKTTADDGTNMVNYLRGQRGNEGAVYRARDHVLGDPINATPAYVRAPKFGFQDAPTNSYQNFKTANANRSPTLYIAANDGMLHAFNADTAVNGGGNERWAYVPRIVYPNLYKLATAAWDTAHDYSADGSPEVMDAYDSTNAAWKTILVAGLNKGGRGFYALDVTDPLNPKAMWEICSDSTLCAISDADMGYSYGNPVITKRAFDGKWVVLVTSGYNNTSTGTGRGYLYVLDAFTGAVQQKVEAKDGATTWGDATTPSGLAKLSAYANSFNTDNTATFVYGGDLFGNVWRFDMSVNPPAVQKLGELKDAGGKPQSITTRPELGLIQTNRVIYIGTGRYLGTNDLSDPATLNPALQWAYQQSIYAFKDKGTNYGNIRASTPGLVQQTLTDNLGTRTITSNPVDWTGKDGWYVDLNPGNTSPGERVNLDPKLVLGTLVVASNVPNNSACTVGGDSFIYQFDYKSGTAISTSAMNVVGTKQTGQITVGVVIVRLPAGVLKGITTGASGTKSPITINIGGSSGSARRVGWRELMSQ